MKLIKPSLEFREKLYNICDLDIKRRIGFSRYWIGYNFLQSPIQDVVLRIGITLDELFEKEVIG